MRSDMLTSSVPQADEWSDVAVSTLLDCYNDKYMELNGGSIGTKGWQDVIFKLNSVCAQGKPVYSYRRCKNKLDVMKRRFKIERDRKATNGGVSDWPWFLKMEQIVGRNPRSSLGSASASASVAAGATVATPALVDADEQRHHHQQKPTHTELGFMGSSCKRVFRSDRIFVPDSSAGLHPSLSLQQQNQPQLHQEDVSASQLLSDQQEEDEDEDDCHIRNSTRPPPSKKRKKNSNCSANPMRHAKEIARIVTEALERMEMKRLEVMRELELKRNETQLQIARMIIESNRMQHSGQPSSSSEPHSYVEQPQ